MRDVGEQDAECQTCVNVTRCSARTKVERPLATVSRLKGRLSVHIIDAEAIPSQLCRVVTSPDKTAIKKQLEAGEHVPGAVLEQGAPTISVRVK